MAATTDEPIAATKTRCGFSVDEVETGLLEKRDGACEAFGPEFYDVWERTPQCVHGATLSSILDA
jgi:hypothetical protein